MSDRPKRIDTRFGVLDIFTWVAVSALFIAFFFSAT